MVIIRATFLILVKMCYDLSAKLSRDGSDERSQHIFNQN